MLLGVEFGQKNYRFEVGGAGEEVEEADGAEGVGGGEGGEVAGEGVWPAGDVGQARRAVTEEAGADGICLINTMLGMRIDIKRRQPVIANKMGGFSGDAVFPVAVRMVYQVAKACDIPVMGCGGVSTAKDVIEMMMAGATAVQVGAANLVDPFACKKIIEELPQVCSELGIEKISDIIGVVD